MATLRFRVPSRIPLVTNFVGAMDLKLGVSIISLFAVLNKVAGAYGMMAVFTGGTTAQLTMYLYSLASIVVFIWGLKKIGEEHGPNTLVYAHLFAVDHFISTIYTALFAVVWYVYVPHDGRRVANSDAQKEMMGEAGKIVDDVARKGAAEAIWKSERGFAAAVLVGGWAIKVYFILCLYSFALHLRRGTYHNLPLSRARASSVAYHRGSRYLNLRGFSAVPQEPVTATDLNTPLAETLWAAGPEPPFVDRDGETSPAAAKGTAMARAGSGTGASGAILQRVDSTGALQRTESNGSATTPVLNGERSISGERSPTLKVLEWGD